MQVADEEVVLVNESDETIGRMEKMEAHVKGLLHRAFSIFIFNKKGEMLLQQRALTKYHSAGLFTNACCSHPRPGETIEQAATRRLQEEMGFITPLQQAFAFTYIAPFDNGLTEHEYDYVLIGEYEGKIVPNPNEVASYKYMTIEVIEQDLLSAPDTYTAWFKIAFPKVKAFLQQQPHV